MTCPVLCSTPSPLTHSRYTTLTCLLDRVCTPRPPTLPLFYTRYILFNLVLPRERAYLCLIWPSDNNQLPPSAYCNLRHTSPSHPQHLTHNVTYTTITLNTHPHRHAPPHNPPQPSTNIRRRHLSSSNLRQHRQQQPTT